jgi:hypothetical protein
MKPTQQLIRDMSREGHPLGSQIHLDEVPALIESLQNHLIVSTHELDLSPSSLKRLEARLIEFHDRCRKENILIPEIELATLVREVTAYIGEVLIIHAGGYWNPKGSDLWSVCVTISGRRKVIKGDEQYKSDGVNFLISIWAAWNWDAIVEGGNPVLYQMYRDAKSKLLRENL